MNTQISILLRWANSPAAVTSEQLEDVRDEAHTNYMANHTATAHAIATAAAYAVEHDIYAEKWIDTYFKRSGEKR